MSLVAEFKRRNVFRVALFYVVSSWVLLQIADLVFELLLVPDWTLRFIFGALLVAFPFVLFLAWAYELTPEGIKREKEVDRSNSVTSETGRKLDIAVIVVVVLGVIVVGADRLVDSPDDTAEVETPPSEGFEGDRATSGSVADGRTAEDAGEAEPATPTIAVLPFVNMSGSEDNEYFSDGLTETLLHRLSQQAGLRVAARTSSFAFKGKDTDIREIADQLGVANVLEGSVQRAGNQVRITAQLIQASDGFHLWSATYDRELDNIFAVQDEIAGEVSQALLGSLLTSGAEGTLASGGTTNPEAYDLYLQALARSRERTERSLVESERRLRRALDLDPDFALAWSALAETLMDHASVAGMDRFEVEDDVLAAARRGVELAPEFSRTVTTLGHAQLFIFQHLSARETFERAVALNPNDAWALSGLKDSLFSTGDIAGAIRVTQRALALDPLDTQLRLNSTYIFITAGQIDRAIEIAESVLAEDPGSVHGLSALANVYYRTGGYAEAIPLYLRILEINPNYANYLLRIAGMVWELGQKDLAWQWVDRAAELVPGFAARWTAMFFCTPPTEQCADRVRLMLEGSTEDQAFGRAVLAEYRGDLAEALDNMLEANRLATVRGSDFNVTMHTAHAARLANELDRPERRDELLEPLIHQQEQEIEAGARHQYQHFYLAQAYALKGDVDRAVEHLAEAIENGARYLDWYRNSGFFDAVLDDPRMVELIKELEADNEREWREIARLRLTPE